ncbi:hypothetical protein [Saccharospirillum salsuginis]|uniref:hypothetical protein n=1 Tax=Saccharospirillum salsuginis TaxID=418750 RepID=UPI001675FA59|nr:hypothetical protein [Saccharospirillum salsuginis]
MLFLIIHEVTSMEIVAKKMGLSTDKSIAGSTTGPNARPADAIERPMTTQAEDYESSSQATTM